MLCFARTSDKPQYEEVDHEKLVSVLIMSATMTFTGTAQATLFNVAHMEGEVDLTSELQAMEFYIGNDYLYWPFGLPAVIDPKQSVHRIGDFAFYNTFVSCLTRTYTPFRNLDGTLDDSNGWNYSYESKSIMFYAFWASVDDFQSRTFYLPIADLSGYAINGFYFHTNFMQNTDTLAYRMDVVADATAVPEPSTALLFLAGMAGVIGIAAMRREAVR